MSIYDENLKALQERHPELVDLIQSPISTDHIEIVTASSGAKRLLVRTEWGETIPIHNAVDPLSVAKRTAEKIDIEKGGVMVLFGMGLGYLPLQLSDKIVANSSLVIFEADPAIFLTAMQHIDLTPLLKSPRVRFLVGPDVGIAGECFQLLLRNGGEYVRAIRYEPAMKLNPTLYNEKLEKELVQYTYAATMNIHTLNRFGPLFSRSTLEAVPNIISAYGINQIKDRFPGIPAILVAAGPSLQKNVQYLVKAKGRAIIICGDTVLGYLLARGIRPDFVVSVDTQEMTFSKYHGVDIPDDIGLVFHPGCNDKIFKQFPGPKFVSATSMPTYHWLQHCWPDKGSIDGENQCQMHMGFSLAKWMGCDPIVIVGQDLCFTDDRMHVKGGSYLTEKNEAAHVAKGTMAVNIFGEQVRTYSTFLSYRSTFERKTKEFSGTVINATEGGLPIAGAENRRLEDVLTEYCNKETEVNVAEVFKGCQDEMPFTLWSILLEEVQWRIQDFHRLERVSRHLSRILEEMALERRQSEKISDRLVTLSGRAERLTKYIPRYSKALGLLPIINYNLELFMSREETDTIDEIGNPEEKLDKQIERGLRYYGDLIRIVPIVRTDLVRLEERLRILKEIQSLQGPDFPGRRERWEATGYQSIGLFDRAAKVIGQGLHGKGATAQDLTLAIELHLSLNEIRLAHTLSVEARRHFPEEPSIISISNQTDAVWEKWQEKRRLAGTLPETSEPSMHKGDFYFRVKDFSRAVEHYRDATQHGLGQIGEAWYRLAKTYQALGRDEEAVEALEEALIVEPSDPRIYFDLGGMALQNHQNEIAERFFMKGAEISLDDPEFCEACGAVLAAAGYQTQAVPFYERALKHWPENQELLKAISKAYEAIFEHVPSA